MRITTEYINRYFTIIRFQTDLGKIPFLAQYGKNNYLCHAMPVYQLSTEHTAFPDVQEAEEEGLLAIGGDLSPDRLINAYASGIYPWFEEDGPLLWWSPDPRMVLFPHQFKLSKSLRQSIRNRGYHVTFDHDFAGVIAHCAKTPRHEDDGTWITNDMQNAYIKLHELGFAHSVETWYNNQLVGGLYGISLGQAFFGESMFHLMTDASKVAFYYLVRLAHHWQWNFIDAQQETGHLHRLGAGPIPRDQFITLLQKAIAASGHYGSWHKTDVNALSTP